MPRIISKKFLLPLGIVLLAAALLFGVFKFRDSFHSDQPQDHPEAQPAESDSEPQPDQTEDQGDDPVPEEEPGSTPPAGPADSVGALSWVVNKARPLSPKTYVPSNLVTPDVRTRAGGTVRSDTAAALEQLFTAAKAAGHDPMMSSGYRSYQSQTSVYNSYVAQDGQAKADTYSARPGYSEHQTGLAVDVCNAGNCVLEESFGATPFGKWIAANAHAYGFTIRYPQGKQHITGYTYEPWHLRFVGTGLAAELHQSGQTLEEHFGLPAAPDYL